MSKKHIYINGKKSVEVEYGADDVVVDVYIDAVKHQFKEDNPNKLEYALATKRKKYAEFLNNQFENLIILTGAGSSVNIGENIIIDEVSTESKGRLLAQLWDDVEAKLSHAIL